MTDLLIFKNKIEVVFKNNNIDKEEVNILFCEALNMSRAELFNKTTLTQKEKLKILRFVKKRLKGVPIQKIFKRAYFFDNVFFINKHVLCPRPETELLTFECMENANDGFDILDLCTGSGCIAITLKKLLDKKQKQSCVVASDISSKALAVAKKNAKKLDADVQFVKSDMFEKFEKNLQKTVKKQQNNSKIKQKTVKYQKKYYKNIPQKFDIIVSNPPYIKTEDIVLLDREVKNNDPIISLDGGIDGLGFYKNIANNACKFLKAKGKIFLEVGAGQAQQVVELLQNNGFDCFVKKDYNGIDRIVVGELL